MVVINWSKILPIDPHSACPEPLLISWYTTDAITFDKYEYTFTKSHMNKAICHYIICKRHAHVHELQFERIILLVDFECMIKSAVVF